MGQQDAAGQQGQEEDLAFITGLLHQTEGRSHCERQQNNSNSQGVAPPGEVIGWHTG